MDLGANNVLGLLRGLSANPQGATGTLKLFEATAAGLEQDTRAMSANTLAVQQATKGHQEATAALRLLDQEVTAFSPKVRTLTTDLAHSQIQSHLAVVPVKQMHEAFRALGPELAVATAQTEQHANAVQRAAQALRLQTSAGMELASKGLVGLIAGRKAQAGMEAVWETARGIALLAEGTWPPNPAAIAAAGLHFEAAAQYALLAGSGGHRRSAGGSGYGAGDTGHGTSADSGSRIPDSAALAPGAAGAGGRFGGSGVVIIRGTQDFENYVANAVNGAVSRGVTVTATSAQRGAPVGH